MSYLRRILPWFLGLVLSLCGAVEAQPSPSFIGSGSAFEPAVRPSDAGGTVPQRSPQSTETLATVSVSTNLPHLCRAAMGLDHGLHRYLCWLLPDEKWHTTPVEDNRSILRLSPYYRTNDGGRSQRLKMSGRGELDLPLLSNFFDIRFTNEEDEEGANRDQLEDLGNSPGSDVGLPGSGRRLWNDLGLNLSWDNGPEAGLRARQGVTWDNGVTETSLDQSVWYRTDEGFGTKSRARWLYRLNESDRLHAQSDVIWEEVGRGVELDQLAGWYRDLPDFRRIGVRGLAFEYTHTSGTLDAAYLRAYYRRAVFKDRVFLHIEPGLSWLARADHETLPTVFVRLETFWGKVDDENLGKFYRRP